VAYISGELSGNSVQLLPTNLPPTTYDESTGMLSIIPASKTLEGTRYVLQTVVEDDGATMFRVNQDIFVIVYKNLANINLEDEQRAMRELLTKTMQEFGSIDQKVKPKKSAWEGKGLKI
jgi:hypothetical protein